MMWFFLLSDAFTFARVPDDLRPDPPHARSAYQATAEDVRVLARAAWPIPDHVFNSFPGMGDANLPLAFVALMTMILIFSAR
ncbi:MAG: hypothetical protein WKG07_29330 [Hymenobacter sp.]